MTLPLRLTPDRVEALRDFVDLNVRRDGCDHSHRFAQRWAADNSVNWDALLDILEENGGFCDCEVVLNLPENMTLAARPPATPAHVANPWLLPPDFMASGTDVFTKMIICKPGIGRNNHAAENEVMVPAPRRAKPRKRIRKSVHFFVGCESGMPSEVGVVSQCDPISAADFAARVSQCGIEELRDFTKREAAFTLSRIASLQPDTPVATHFMEKVAVAGKHEELRLHRVFLRR